VYEVGQEMNKEKKKCNGNMIAEKLEIIRKVHKNNASLQIPILYTANKS